MDEKNIQQLLIYCIFLEITKSVLKETIEKAHWVLMFT